MTKLLKSDEKLSFSSSKVRKADYQSPIYNKTFSFRNNHRTSSNDRSHLERDDLVQFHNHNAYCLTL